MSATHDYDTVQINAEDLDGTHTLVGACGGLSSVFEVFDTFNGGVDGILLEVQTEHGSLFLAPDESVEVLAS